MYMAQFLAQPAGGAVRKVLTLNWLLHEQTWSNEPFEFIGVSFFYVNVIFWDPDCLVFGTQVKDFFSGLWEPVCLLTQPLHSRSIRTSCYHLDLYIIKGMYLQENVVFYLVCAVCIVCYNCYRLGPYIPPHLL